MQPDIRQQLEEKIFALQEEVESWKCVVADMRDALLTEVSVSIVQNLTEKESLILGILMRKRSATKAQLWQILYGCLPDVDQPDPKVILVFISHMRTKLRPYGVEIRSSRALGYWIDQDSIANLKGEKGRVRQ